MLPRRLAAAQAYGQSAHVSLELRADPQGLAPTRAARIRASPLLRTVADHMCLSDGTRRGCRGNRRWLIAHFIAHFGVHLLSNQVANMLTQKLQEGGEIEVLASQVSHASDDIPEATDIHTEGCRYFEDPPKQDDFDDISEATDMDTEGGSYFEDPPKQDDFEANGGGFLTDSEGNQGSMTCNMLPGTVNYVDNHLVQAACDRLASNSIGSSAVSDIDFSGAQSTCDGTPDTMRQ